MKTLHVDLQTGFEGDTVTVIVDGDTVYNDSEVNTSLMTGLAASFEVSVGAGTHQIEVRLPGRAITGSTSVEMDQELYLGISIENEEVVFRLSEEPFGYM